MINFQDILKQRDFPYGPLWCDQSAYKIAKEIQSLQPDEFDNIFLGMGDFHTERMVAGSIGKFLEGRRAAEIFGPDTVKAVMNGGHYNRSKSGFNIFFLYLRLTLNILKIFIFFMSLHLS